MIETTLVAVALCLGFLFGYRFGSDMGFLKGNVKAVQEGAVPLKLHPALAPKKPKPGHVTRPNPQKIRNIKQNAGKEYPPDMIRKDFDL